MPLTGRSDEWRAGAREAIRLALVRLIPESRSLYLDTKWVEAELGRLLDEYRDRPDAHERVGGMD